MVSPAESLTAARAAPAAGVDLARRIRVLMAVRTVIISIVLGVSYWLSWLGGGVSSGTSAVLSIIIAATYATTLVGALLLRGGVDPERLVWPQLAGDLALTSTLVYVTGGAQSAFTFLFALSIVGASAVRYGRGAAIVAVASVGLMTLVALLAKERLLPLPMVPQVAPWNEPASELGRTLALNLAAIVAVGALSYVFGDQLRRTAASLASERRVVADLVTLHQDIVRSLTSGLITTDPEWRVLTINQAAVDILGGGDDGFGRDLDALLPGVRARMAGVEPRTPLRRADLTLVRPDGKLVLGISVSPLLDDAGAVVGRVINFQDLTELRRMEREVQRAERMATIGQLASGIAHEIRNPLASISGSIELLRQAPEVAGDDRALMEIVTREIDRLNGLIGQLLEFANPRPRQVIDFDLAVLVDETVRVFQQDRSFADVDVKIAPHPAAVAMAADPAKLRQVMWNLLRNGAEAAAGGGRHVVASLAADADWALLEIDDDGPGIPPELVPRIFDPFFTTKKRGTGLGLATCHAIVTEHGGTIEVASELGKGTRFTVRLPRRAPATSATGEVPAVA